MTDSSQVTLNQFFAPEKGLSRKSLSRVGSSAGVSSLKEKLLSEARVQWPLAFEIIMKKVGDVLNIGISDIIGTAWSKYEILLKYLDKEKYPPDETFLVTMAEHEITSEHRPFLEILLNDRPIGKIDFEITVSLMIEGIKLEIQDGRIKKLLAGTCKGEGTVKCENQLILNRTTRPVSLPGTVDFKAGIPIMP
jgi:hypothetical protein